MINSEGNTTWPSENPAGLPVTCKRQPKTDKGRRLIALDTYSHVAPGLQEAAANRFDEIILSPSKQEVH